MAACNVSLFDTAEAAGYLVIDSSLKGLHYIVDPADKTRAMVVTSKIAVVLTLAQARAIGAEVPECIELYAGKRRGK